MPRVKGVNTLLNKVFRLEFKDLAASLIPRRAAVFF